MASAASFCLCFMPAPLFTVHNQSGSVSLARMMGHLHRNAQKGFLPTDGVGYAAYQVRVSQSTAESRTGSARKRRNLLELAEDPASSRVSQCEMQTEESEFTTDSFDTFDNSCRGRRLIATCMAGSIFILGGLLQEGSSWAAAENTTVKYYTNLDDAREAGERRREEKEREQGPIVTLPSGVKFRELLTGPGKGVEPGDVVSVAYTIYRFNGAYVDSLGYGKEGKDDVGETFDFTYGSTKVPRALELGLEGMRVGGRRRILVPPNLGWPTADIKPSPTTNAALRRFSNASGQPLLFELEVVKAKALR